MKKVSTVLVIVLILVVGVYFYFAWQKDKGGFRVIFFDIGQGDAALIQFNDGQKMLVDCGPDRRILSKLGKYLSFYRRDLDYLLVTHPDLDHYGGCVDVLKRYKVKKIIINGKEKFDSYFKIWDATMKAEGAEIKIMKEPEEWLIASTTLEFIAPDSSLAVDPEKAEGNNASIVFKLLNGRTNYLFTGDMEEPLEKALVQKYCSLTTATRPHPTLSSQERIDTSSFSFEEKVGMRSGCPAIQADVLKVGHHGSDSSSGEDFLRLVSPARAVISSGQNKYGHPSLRVLKKLERAGAEILRTDEVGEIVIP